MAKYLSLTSWLCVLLICACEVPTAPELDDEEEVYFLASETPAAPKKLAAIILEESIADLSWEVVSPFTDQVRIKKHQFLTDANNHPCDLQLIEIFFVEGQQTSFRDTLDLKQGNFVRYTFSTVYNNVLSLKKNELEVVFPK